MELMIAELFTNHPQLRAGMVCFHFPMGTISDRPDLSIQHEVISRIEDISGDGIFVRRLRNVCRNQKFHLHFDVARSDWFTKDTPSISSDQTPPDLGPADGTVARAYIQFTFALPLRELPIGSLINPRIDVRFANPGMSGAVYMNSGSLQIETSAVVKKVSFELRKDDDLMIYVTLRGTTFVNVGNNSIESAFSEVFPEFERLILAKSVISNEIKA